MTERIVSVVMPLYNEEKYIKGCVESLLLQDYPRENMEWIFVDGGSTDATKEILADYCRQHPELIRVYDNPRKTVPYAMNIGIEAAVGRYIVRMDAHAEYANDYISQCVACLDTTDADNVGGVAETKSRGKMGSIIARMLSSKFGVGNSRFRTNGASGYVDTVPFGAFRRNVFERLGGYDERLTRNQDNEMNFRIRKNGGKIYLSRDIRLAYYCRDTVRGIVNMAKANGKWNVITMKMCPGAMAIRHIAPLAMEISILFLGQAGFLRPVFWSLLATELGLYLLLDVWFSAKQAGKWQNFVHLLYLFPVFHLTYGVGSLMGIFSLCSRKYSAPYQPPRIHPKVEIER